MYPYILCFCGKSLGDIYDLFHALRQEKYYEVYGKVDTAVRPAFITLNTDTKVVLEDVFTMLNVHLDCCKTRLLTQVSYSSYY